MIEALVYGEESAERYEIESSDDLRRARDARGVTWIRATEAAPEELRRVADTFDVHPLTVEDVERNVRPKTEEFPDCASVLVEEAELVAGDRSFDEEIRDEPVGIFVGDEWPCTLSTASIAAVDGVWSAVARGDIRIRNRGADFAAYRVVDRIVDGYFNVLDVIGTVEEEVLVSTEIETLERTKASAGTSSRFATWRGRRATRSGRSRAATPTGSSRRPRGATAMYDHFVGIVDLTETYRDPTGGARDIHLNTVSQSTNEVMKTLTVVATVFSR